MAAPFTIRLESQAAAEDERCIASIAYPGAFAGAARGPVVATGLSPLDDDRRCQNWYAKDPVRRAREGPLCYAFNDELLFGHVHFAGDARLEPETGSAYRTLLRVLDRHGVAPLRMWHYLPRINDGARYRAFCRARAQALGATPQSRYCAATVIGTRAAHGVFYFLAARGGGVAIENPRQVSAYRYPPRYADPPPTFARATLKRWRDGCRLHVSGTAAIVGHESTHAGDVVGQFGEIVRNFEALIGEAARVEPAFADATLADLSHCAVYLDPRADKNQFMDAARARLAPRFDTIPWRLFRGEMCRPELLVEVEGALEVEGPVERPTERPAEARARA